MDWIRFGYTSKMRLWKDDPTEITVRWFRAADDAKRAAPENAFSSSVWLDKDTFIYRGRPGEVVGPAPKWDGKLNPLGYAGKKACGPLGAWAQGGTHGVDPVIHTNADGSSTCCGDLPETDPGGIGFGEPAPLRVEMEGGKGLGGAWEEQRAQTSAWSGGKGLGGAWLDIYPAAYTWSGGSGAGGTWIYNRGIIVPWSGGKGLGGAWLDVYPAAYDWSGGKGLGGAWVAEDDTVIAGTILAYGGSSAPSGYLLCDGTSYLRATYPGLFAIIGTTFGAVDGTHFNVPDLRRRVPMGAGGTSVSGPANTVGSVGGAETVTLTQAEMPAHVHLPGAGTLFLNGAGGAGTLAGLAAGTANTTSAATAAQGSGNAHNNVQPSLVTNYLIKT